MDIKTLIRNEVIEVSEIKSELNFGLNDFGKQSTMTQAQTIAQMLVNLFLMRPGQLPSLPHIGINIRQYMYKFEDEIDVSYIRSQITAQCPDLIQYIDLANMQLLLFPYKDESIMYLFVPLSVAVAENTALSIGFKKSNTSNEITFNYQINNNLDV